MRTIISIGKSVSLIKLQRGDIASVAYRPFKMGHLIDDQGVKLQLTDRKNIEMSRRCVQNIRVIK